MKKYVEAEKAEEAFCKYLGFTSVRAAVASEKILDRVPATDVEEVRHGEWIVEKINGKMACYCSKCGVGVKDEKTNSYMDMTDSSYCPNCGAKMGGGKE